MTAIRTRKFSILSLVKKERQEMHESKLRFNYQLDSNLENIIFLQKFLPKLIRIVGQIFLVPILQISFREKKGKRCLKFVGYR